MPKIILANYSTGYNLKQLRRYIISHWGTNCATRPKDVCYSCFVCRAWLAYSILEDMQDTMGWGKKKFKKKKT